MGEEQANPPHPNGDPADATLLLHRIEDGDSSAAEQLLPLVYDELRAIAGSYFRAQRADHTLQPTALVHEAYLKLVRARGAEWQDSAHFRAVAATAMRQILANHAEAKKAAKRGGQAQRVSLDQITSPSGDKSIDTVALHDALTRLEQTDERLARVVELCFFGGFTLDEAAAVLNTSRSTVARAWRQARAILNADLAQASLA